VSPSPKRENNARAKRIRKELRERQAPCHICGGEINYDTDHLDPLSFQVDHLWQVAHGGPAYDIDNCASAHRACNRLRSDHIDDITIQTALSYGVVIKRPDTDPPATVKRCPQGVLCLDCNGTHDPQPGVTFVTARKWW